MAPTKAVITIKGDGSHSRNANPHRRLIQLRRGHANGRILAEQYSHTGRLDADVEGLRRAALGQGYATVDVVDLW